MTFDQNDPLLNEKQLSARLGLSGITLRKWRMVGDGPRFLKLGGAVRYPESAVRTWLASCAATSTKAA